VATTHDYYDLLGVARDATADEIKRAYRSRARESHPDTSDHHDAEERFKEVNEAYEVLSDPERRATYDRFGTADPRAAGYGDPFGGGGVPVDDIFSMFFGGGFGTAGRAAAPAPEGRDMTAQLAVTLEEAAAGAEKELTFTRDATCRTCEGSGSTAGGSVVTCPVCGGTGQQVTTRQTFLGTMRTSTSCGRCDATGVVVEDPCPTCGGSGRARTQETVLVSVPAGIQDGEALLVEGAGEAGLRGARPGDLHVGVRVERHPTLHRQGDDLHVRVKVPLPRALLGGDVTVPGLTGPETVQIPAGSSTGDSVKVKGSGMPRAEGRQGLFGTKTAGDLYVHLDIDIPKKLTRAQKKLVGDLADSLAASDELEAEPLGDWLR
jgi:molecular chaperone DnaJ